MNRTPKEIFSESEKLFEMGLGLPEVIKLMQDLTFGGVKVPTSVLTIDEAEKILIEKLKDKR